MKNYVMLIRYIISISLTKYAHADNMKNIETIPPIDVVIADFFSYSLKLIYTPYKSTACKNYSILPGTYEGRSYYCTVIFFN